jgi:hypothetical protein
MYYYRRDEVTPAEMLSVLNAWCACAHAGHGAWPFALARVSCANPERGPLHCHLANRVLGGTGRKNWFPLRCSIPPFTFTAVWDDQPTDVAGQRRLYAMHDLIPCRSMAARVTFLLLRCSEEKLAEMRPGSDDWLFNSGKLPLSSASGCPSSTTVGAACNAGYLRRSFQQSQRCRIISCCQSHELLDVHKN